MIGRIIEQGRTLFGSSLEGVRGEPATLSEVLQQFPAYEIDRHSPRKSGRWKRWADAFLRYYQGVSGQDQSRVLEVFLAHFSGDRFKLPEYFFVLEVLWDFGKSSSSAGILPDFSLALLHFQKQKLSPEQFATLVLPGLRRSPFLPQAIRLEFDPHEAVPSVELAASQKRLERVRALEKLILAEHQLPEDVDEMIYVLQKMSKGKMGLPRQSDFLARVLNKFPLLEDADELREALKKLRHKQSEWFQTQHFETR